MKPVNQLIVHDPDNGVWGDCFRACIASLLEMDCDLVPHFCDKNNVNWLVDLQDWLDIYGLFYMDIGIGMKPEEFFKNNCNKKVYHVITGPSPRFKDMNHCVVGKNGKIEFDPHPDKIGLSGSYKDWMFGFIINTCK